MKPHEEPDEAPANEQVSQASQASQVSGLEQEVASRREHVKSIVHELDRRVHNAVDWRGHWQRHKVLVLVGGASLAGLVAGGAVWARRKRRRSERFINKASQFNLALRRAVAHPERVAPGAPTIGGRVLTAALSTTATLLIKQMFAQLRAGRAAPTSSKHWDPSTKE